MPPRFIACIHIKHSYYRDFSFYSPILLTGKIIHNIQWLQPRLFTHRPEPPGSLYLPGLPHLLQLLLCCVLQQVL